MKPEPDACVPGLEILIILSEQQVWALSFR